MNLNIFKRTINLLIIGCVPLLSLASCSQDVHSQRRKVLKQTTKAFLNSRPDLDVVAVRSGINHDTKHQDTFGLSLTTKKISDVDHARAIIVDAFQELLFFINNNENLGPHLDSNEFPSQKLSLTIRSTENEDKQISVMIACNKITYYTSNPGDEFGRSIVLCEETLEEALAILEKERTSNQPE